MKGTSLLPAVRGVQDLLRDNTCKHATSDENGKAESGSRRSAGPIIAVGALRDDYLPVTAQNHAEPRSYGGPKRSPQDSASALPAPSSIRRSSTVSGRTRCAQRTFCSSSARLKTPITAIATPA